MKAQVSRASAVTIRRATVADAATCGPICYEAFRTISEEHRFPPDLPSVEAGIGVLSHIFSHPEFYCVVAEVEGKPVGSNCLDERGSIAGIGPITIDPKAQNHGLGRALMLAVMNRAREHKFAGVRLVQAAFHCRSMSLYTKLGFVVREPLMVMQGSPSKEAFGAIARVATPGDAIACDELCVRIHGHTRSGELRDALLHGAAKVAERNGRIVAYTSGLAFFGYSVAETTEDLCALIGSEERMGGPGILVPTRNHQLFNWCLNHGLKAVEPMTLMTMGLYNEPSGAFLASISF